MNTATPRENKQLVMITGESSTGKSASLRNIRDQDKWLYLNCESGKSLPFRNEFMEEIITDPYDVHDFFDEAAENPDDCIGIIIDTGTFLMDMVETQVVLSSSDTFAGWTEYAQYFKILMQEKVAAAPQAVIMLFHTRAEYDEASMSYRTAVPIKGSLKNNGIEAYGSTVVSTKTVPLDKLEKMDEKLLTVSPVEEALGYKHVFQTQLTKETVGERIRSPMGMFDPMTQIYMDNDAQMLLDHLKDYYHG